MPEPTGTTQSTSAPEGKLIIVSNRLPVSLAVDGATWRCTPSSGGLVSALSGLEDRMLSWVGWPGCEVPEHLRAPVTADLAERGLVPVFLDREAEDRYYHGICNRVLWPLFHYFPEKVDFQHRDWEQYVEANRCFAAAIEQVAPPDAEVWIHDFHLMLLPGMLRRTRPDLAIGYFLHIPFPSSEIYRVLPVGEELLEGLLGADYIGFHTHDYARHFRAACLRVLGVESEHNAIHVQGRRIGIGAHPIGIDTDGFERRLQQPKTLEWLLRLDSRYRGQKLILGVERLDYTKGVWLKLRAFERLLEKDRSLASEVRLLQVLVPSRVECSDYRELKREIEEYVGRINGRFGRPGLTPVEYMYRSLAMEELVALYRFADVGMVTPIRDGMNLVAQEFVLCQDEIPGLDHAHRGVLVLSEFAGAAQVLPRALMTNPWDIERTVATLEVALRMEPRERATRMAVMAGIVRDLRCSAWAAKFMRRFGSSTAASRQVARLEPLSERSSQALVDRFATAGRRVLFIDYDGTLREIVATPAEAVPSEEILDLLAGLAALPDTEVHIVSGRRRADLQEWLGDLEVHLSGEHGYAWRPPGQDWQEERDVDLSWIPEVASMLEDVADEVPGTRVERKPCALAWHYRTADLDYGLWRARQLLAQLQDDLADLPAEVIHGHRVIEVRPFGVDKGRYVERILAATSAPGLVIGIGDDRTDEDLYTSLPADSVRLHVGDSAEGATHALGSPAEVRELLRAMVAAATGRISPSPARSGTPR